QRVEGLGTALGVDAEIKDRTQLQQELAEFVREVPDVSLVQLRGSSGTVMLPVPEQPVFPSGPQERYTVTIQGRLFRALSRPLTSAGETYTVQVAASLDEVGAILDDFRRLLVWMIPAVLILACVGGYWLSSRALAPVDEITSVAKTISVQNLSRRIASPQTGDELQRMAETWNEVLGRLDAAVQRIRQFTQDASHELRTPLTLIRATAELALRREREPAEYRASLRQVVSEAERMTVLTESLLTLARADTHGMDMALTATDLSLLVNSVVEQNAARALEKGVTLRARSAAQSAVAAADAAGLRRVLMILVDNALKHTPSGGAITLSTAAVGRSVMLAVEDTGDGIAADAMPHLFERFYRADEARGSGNGFGLGLAIAQAIARAHGTSITVESSPGAGARFSLTLRA
ncbi:MAG: ATP-binding protein, partial [Candidatus Solibacter sp.]|nr:ATP-binding protein [Candidatus Solibacter sp.]